MSNKFASDRNAIASCDRCGFRYKLNELKQLVIKDKLVNILVCPECWEPDQPQLLLGKWPVNDPQALREPRPERGVAESRNMNWGWRPSVPNVSGTATVGTVTIS